MIGEPIALVTVDVGGTLGTTEQPGMSAALLAASPLPRADAARIIRRALYTVPTIGDDLLDHVRHALDIPSGTPMPASGGGGGGLRLFPGTPYALALLSALLPVVTVSNVTCLDAHPHQMQQQLGAWVREQRPSYRTGYAKPDPRAFTSVAAYWNLRPGQLVHIGDDWECDVLGAIAAGVRPIWISGGRPPPADGTLVAPDVLMANDIAAAADLIHDHILTSSRRST